MKSNQLFVIFTVFLLIGCSAGELSTATPTFTSTITQTTQVQTETPTVIVPTITPIPTLTEEDAREKLLNLLANNGGCQLPCWWGITPGKTTWDLANTFLSSVPIKEIGEPIMINDGSIYITFRMPTQKELGTLNHTYKIKNGVVVGIEAYVFDWSPFLYLSNILTEYGPPDGVFITTYRYTENGIRPYNVHVIYEKLGILFLYSNGDASNMGDDIENCFDNLYSPFVFIWSVKDEPLSEGQINDRFSSKGMPYPISLKEAAGMSIDTFYETFKNPSNSNCLVTPADLWPEP